MSQLIQPRETGLEVTQSNTPKQTKGQNSCHWLTAVSVMELTTNEHKNPKISLCFDLVQFWLSYFVHIWKKDVASWLRVLNADRVDTHTRSVLIFWHHCNKTEGSFLMKCWLTQVAHPVEAETCVRPWFVMNCCWTARRRRGTSALHSAGRTESHKSAVLFKQASRAPVLHREETHIHKRGRMMMTGSQSVSLLKCCCRFVGVFSWSNWCSFTGSVFVCVFVQQIVKSARLLECVLCVCLTRRSLCPPLVQTANQRKWLTGPLTKIVSSVAYEVRKPRWERFCRFTLFTSYLHTYTKYHNVYPVLIFILNTV